MTAVPMKNNPAFLTDEELESVFVVRDVDLQLLLEAVQENDGAANRHLLVVSARGMGKTTLVRRLALAVRRDEALAARWYPIVLPEETYEVLSAGELWLTVLRQLAHQESDENLTRIHDELRQELDETRLQERALTQLRAFATARESRLIVVAENLNLLFDDQLDDEDAHALRHVLQTDPTFMLVGTATSRFEQIDNSKKALFEQFRLHDLPPLDTDQCRTLWQSLTDQDLAGRRVRPIEILTGGNPRLITILGGFAVNRSLREVLGDLARLIDENTTYFKAILETLPPLERKVFITLADIWEPALARQVAERSRVSPSKASAVLKRLVGRGVVTETQRDGRKIRYQVSERLYALYHHMRRSERPESRVRALVRFMLDFYENDALLDVSKAILDEAGSLSHPDRLPHLIVFRELLRGATLPDQRADLLRQCATGVRKLAAGLSEADRSQFVATTGQQLEELALLLPPDARCDSPKAWFDLCRALIADDQAQSSEGVRRVESAAMHALQLLVRQTARCLFASVASGHHQTSRPACRAKLDVWTGDRDVCWNEASHVLSRQLMALRFAAAGASDRLDEVAEEQLDEKKDDGIIRLARGLLNQAEGRSTAAAEDFLKARSLAPSDPLVSAVLAFSLARNNRRPQRVASLLRECAHIEESRYAGAELAHRAVGGARPWANAYVNLVRSVAGRSDFAPGLALVLLVPQAYGEPAAAGLKRETLLIADRLSETTLPEDSPLPFVLCASHARTGDRERAAAFLARGLEGPETRGASEFLRLALKGMVDVGAIELAVRTIEESPRSSEYEPLIATLRMELGQKVVVPLEIREVALDVRKWLRGED